MPILVLDGAGTRCAAALWADNAVIAQAMDDGAHGHAVRLPPLAAQVLESGRPDVIPDLIAVTVGPGSFTGLRAALSLAHGLAAGFGVAVIGVTVAEALRHDAAASGLDRSLCVALAARRGFLFLDDGAGPVLHALDALPQPTAPIALAGDAANEAAARWQDCGHDVAMTDLRLPSIAAIARVAARRAAGQIPPIPAQPLYVDAPQVTRAAGMPA